VKFIQADRIFHRLVNQTNIRDAGKTQNSICLTIKSLNKTILKSLGKENLYQIINSETSTRGLLFEKIGIGKGAEIGFIISYKYARKVYGNILSTSVEGKMIYHSKRENTCYSNQ